jgi:hypothetical protein
MISFEFDYFTEPQMMEAKKREEKNPLDTNNKPNPKKRTKKIKRK